MGEQHTLTGEVVDAGQLPSSQRTPDGYWLYCPECDDRIPRHARHDHGHKLYIGRADDG